MSIRPLGAPPSPRRRAWPGTSARGLPTLAALALLSLAACTEVPPAGPAQPTASPTATPAPSGTASAAASGPDWSQVGVPRLLADAERLRAVVKSDDAKRFLARVPLLPKIPTRPLFRDADKSRYYTEAEALALPADARASLQPFAGTEDVYYSTSYGSPLSYSRPIDILSAKGVSLKPGTKVLDFGYGYIGHLRLFATMGVQATGVDVNPLLRALYASPGDTGAMTGPEGEKGSVRLVDGFFPSDPATVSAVGGGYDLVISKNVLKKGYINPDRPVPHPERQISLKVKDEVAIKAFFDTLVPGGWFMIYNICPAPTPPDKPFVPYSDGRSPFNRAQWEAGGFEVVVFDEHDEDAVRTMAKALGWDQPWEGDPGMDLVNDLSVLYTLVRRPPAR